MEPKELAKLIEADLQLIMAALKGGTNSAKRHSRHNHQLADKVERLGKRAGRPDNRDAIFAEMADFTSKEAIKRERINTQLEKATQHLMRLVDYDPSQTITTHIRTEVLQALVLVRNIIDNAKAGTAKFSEQLNGNARAYTPTDDIPYTESVKEALASLVVEVRRTQDNLRRFNMFCDFCIRAVNNVLRNAA